MARRGESAQRRIAVLEQNRELIQAVIEYNQKLSPGQQAAAERRIAGATRQLYELDQELAALRKR